MSGGTKVKLKKTGAPHAINIPAFNHDPPIASCLFRNRINLERFDKRSRGVRQTHGNEKIHQRFSVSEIEHCPGYPLMCSLRFERRPAFNRLNPATKSFRRVSSRAVAL